MAAKSKPKAKPKPAKKAAPKKSAAATVTPTTPAPEKPKRAKQQSFEGMSDPKIEALTDAACEYAEVRDRRMELSKEEHEKKSRLVDAMHEHDKTRYYDRESGVLVELSKASTEEKVKVRINPTGTDKDKEE